MHDITVTFRHPRRAEYERLLDFLLPGETREVFENDPQGNERAKTITSRAPSTWLRWMDPVPRVADYLA